VLAFLIAAGVIVAAIVELDARSGDEPLAIPTLGPALSPSAAGPTLSPSASARPSPSSTPRASAGAAATSAATPQPSFSRTPKPEPTAERTAAPPRTPTPSPEPTLPVGPIDKSQGPTPHTGGGAVGNGLLIAGLALVARAVILPRCRNRA
jgi:hypothetical protein